MCPGELAKSDDELRAGLLQQQRDVRTWLLIAGVMLTGVDVLCAYVMGGVLALTTAVRDDAVRFDLLVLAGIVLIWWLGRARPVRCCVIGTAAYWVAQTHLVVVAPTLFVFVLVIKLAVTGGLERSIHAARRTERELQQRGIAPASLPVARGWLRRAPRQRRSS